MKTHCSILAVALTLAVGSAAGADHLRSRFELEHPLDGTFAPGDRGRVVVTGDVFGQSRDFPHDVRIVGSDGTQWPCFLHVPRDTPQTVSIDLTVLNAAWVDGAEPYLQFDLVVPTDGPVPVHNQLELVTTGRDFVRRVEVFSGNEAGGHMASGYLIGFSSLRDARNRIIRYPDSDAMRLHVRIYPNAQAAGERFQLTRAYLRHLEETPLPCEAVAFVGKPATGREQVEAAQTRLLDLEHTGRPVEFIRFDIANDAYTRCVSVYGRDSGHDPWRRVGGGEIHALPDDRNDTIKVNTRCRFLKVQVFHYDDQPLDIAAIRLEAVPRYLVFEAASAGPASLYFRAWDVAAPHYDLRSRIDTDAIDALPEIGLQDIRLNAMAKAQPWRKYSRLLAGVAVGAVSLLVIWIIVGMLRQQRFPEQGTRD